MKLLERRLEILGCLEKFNKEKRKNIEVSAEALPSELLFMLVDVTDHFWWQCIKDLQGIELEENEYRGATDPLDEVAADCKRLDAISNQDYLKHLESLEFSSYCMNSATGYLFSDEVEFDCDTEAIEDQFEFDCDTDCRYFCNSEVSSLGLDDNGLSMQELQSLFIMKNGLGKEFVDFLNSY